MAASIVKSKNADTSGSGPVTSITATFDSGGTATAGNLLVALHSAQGEPVVTGPSGWTAGPTNNYGPGFVRLSSWYKIAAGGETGATVGTDSAKQQGLDVFEVTGTSSSPFDVSGTSDTGVGNTSPLSSASLSTTTAGIVFAHFGQNYNATSAWSLSNSFTAFGLREGWHVSGYRVTSASGSYSTSLSWTGTAKTASVILAFKETSAAPVTKTLSAVWNTRAVASKALIARHNVRAFATKSLVTLWHVRANASKPLITLWQVRANASKPLSTLWTTRGTASKDLSAVWGIGGSVNSPLVAVWGTRTTIGEALATQWNVRVAASKNVTALWTTRGNATKNVTALWGVRAFVSEPLSAVWHTRIYASESLTALYTVRANASKPLSTLWTTRGSASDSLIVRWGTRAFVDKDLTANWHTRIYATKPLTAQWAVEALLQVNKSLIVIWHVAEPPAPIQIFVPTFVSVQDTISKSHRKTARIVVYDSLNGKQIYASDDLLVPGGLITGGVNFTNALVRRRSSLSFIDRTGELTPGDADDIFTTYGHVFKVWRGVVVNGINYDFPLGAFGITDVSVDDSGPGIQIAVEGYDYGDLMSRRGLIQDYTVPKGTNFVTAIQDLLSQQMPGIEFNFVTSSYTTPALFFQTNANPWEAAVMMAKSIGCDLFFDPNGICTMRNVPDYSVVPVGYTYEEGEASTALYVNKRYTNRDAYNYFIVTGEHSGNATTGGGGPIRGDAYDDNPASKTYWKGTYGTVPAPPVSSKLVTTQAQAEQAARGLLQNSIGKAERLHFNAIVNPLHEVGDVIQFTRGKSKIDDRYVIDSGYIPLGHDQAMDLTTRVRQSTA